MSEYWVSKKKYFCKYCDIYIADDVPSRQHHESGLRHKGNLERFIRGIYKAGEKRKKDQEEERREMAQVEKAAQAAYAHDISSGNAKASSSKASLNTPAATPAVSKERPKPSNPYANYTTAANLGITDPDLERATAEADRRRTQGTVGEWQVVDSTPLAPPEAKAEGQDSSEGQVEDSAPKPNDENVRTFKLGRRAVAVGLGEIYDPTIIPIRVKKSEEKKADGMTDTGGLSEEKEPERKRMRQWVKVEGEASIDEEKQANMVKQEEAEQITSTADKASTGTDPVVKTEEEVAVTTGPTFKKRKVPTRSGQGRR